MNPRLPRMSWTAMLAVLVSLPFPCGLFAAIPGEPIPAATGEAPCPAAAEAPVGEESTADLLRRGDREGRSGRLAEALEAWRKAFQRRVPGFRKVPFLFPVEAEYMDK